MSESRQMLFLYPEGAAPNAQTGWGRAVAVLREQGVQVEELVIGDSFEMVLDRLAQGVVPVVVKAEDA